MNQTIYTKSANRWIKSNLLLFALVISILQVNAQSISSHGNIVDESGNPIIGCSVMIKGTTKGTVTDMDGNFTLKTELGDVLSISYIGYTDQEIATGNKTHFDVILSEDAMNVEEVVVVGFATQKKVNLTGSVAVADTEVFKSRPVTNATQALQGAVPGLNISKNTGGSPMESADINIRGIGTIGEGSDGAPLILIDGMEGDINTINPQDIESISVLKDAAASSIYGSRAPFGVILITTKRGASGKMTVNYNNSFRFSSPLNLPNSIDSYRFVQYVNEARANNGDTPYYNDDQIQRTLDYQNGVITTVNIPDPDNPLIWADGNEQGNANVDYYDLIYKDIVFGQEHNASISGGSDQHQIYASINYLDQGGMLDWGADEYQRLTSTIRATGELSKKVSYSYSVKYQHDYFAEPYYIDDLNWKISSGMKPNIPVYDDNGYYQATGNVMTVDKLENGGKNTTKRDRLYQQFQLVASPLEGWNITGEVNYSLLQTHDHSDIQKMYYYGTDETRYEISKASTTSVYEENQTDSYYNVNLFTDYAFDINNNHNFKFLAGMQVEHQAASQFSAERNGILVYGMDVIDVTTGLSGDNTAVSPSVSGANDEWATAGFFGRMNYDYEGRYLLEVNLRYDGTSRFRAEDRWDLFPSVSGGWNIAREDFWSDYEDILNTFKLRASYGELGNQNTTNLYPTYAEMVVGSVNGSWLINGAQPNTSQHPDLLNSAMTWETIKTTNVGLDLAAFRNRLSASFDIFSRTTENMVGPAQEMPDILGTDVPLENNTSMRTNGWEVSLRWNDRTKSGIGYSVGFNLADAKTKVLDYPNPSGTLYLNCTTGTPRYYNSGEYINNIYGYETIGIAKSQEEMDAHLASLPNGAQDALMEVAWAAGDIMFKDLNGDGKIDSGAGTVDDTGDMKIIGNSTPRYTFGLDLSADYKGFDFRVFFQGVMKRDFMSNSPTFWGSAGGLWQSVILAEHMDYFREDPNHEFGQNLDAYYPRPLMGTLTSKNDNNTYQNYQSQSGYIQDASYIRLKNLQIGYTFSNTAMSRIGVSNFRVFVSGENLWTGTSLSSVFDPETIDGGVNGITYPLQTTISLGANLNF
ncbi:MAG: TonB-dependent receptor [Rikenellaceae bacterium]